MEGWIKVHRQIIESEFYFSERFTKQQAWIDLLLLATHKERTVYLRGVEVRLKPGQLCYSQISLSGRWKWNFKTVNKFLITLGNRKMVETKKTNITTIITIKNWFLYQVGGVQNGEQKECRMETNKNVKNVNIELAKTLTLEVKNESSLYSIIGKYKNEIGEGGLKGILADCVKRGNEFRTEEQLASYLQTCSKSNNKSTPEISFNPVEVNR